MTSDISANGTGMPGGSTQITGDFTREEAQELSILIEGGALPVPVEIIEQRRVGRRTQPAGALVGARGPGRCGHALFLRGRRASLPAGRPGARGTQIPSRWSVTNSSPGRLSTRAAPPCGDGLCLAG